jgi:alpha-tubulin suppressor-like RCC1 family protein
MNRNPPWRLLPLALLACNRPPEAPTVTLMPDEPTTADDLVATWEGAPDPDGDAVIWEVRWLVDGEEHSTAISTGEATLSGEETTRGETWTVEVVASDGHVRSAAASDSVMILNSKPETSVTVEPALPLTNDTLRAVTTSSDLDRDPLTLSWVWTRDGEATPFTDQDVPPAATERGQVWTVHLRSTDGEEEGDETVASVEIGNTPPLLSSLVVDPPSPTVTDPPTARVQFDDPDGDAVVLSWAWTINGAPVATTPHLDPAVARWNQGDVLEVVVTATDGHGGRTELRSGAITAANNPPALTQDPVITPAAPRVADLLACTAPTVDTDGDPVTLAWTWTRNGLLWSNESAIPAAGFDRGDVIACTLTPNDGATDGPARTSEVVIQNTPPVARARIEPVTPGTEDTLVATPVLRSDADDDDVTLRHTWYVNGAAVATGPALDPSHTERGDEVVLETTPNDTLADGATTRTDPVRVGNTLPVVRSVAILPDPPSALTELSAAVDAVDADGDPILLEHRWWIDGALASTEAVLPPGSVRRGQSVVVEVTPSDPSGSGALAASDAVVAINSPPTASSVRISPTEISEVVPAACIPTGSYDPDGDPVGGVIQWQVNGVTVAEGPTLSGKHFNKGQQVSCLYQPADDLVQGTVLTSESVTVSNSPPSLSAVHLSPSTPRRGGPVAAQPEGVYDPDPADQARLIVQTRWEVDGVEVARAPLLEDTLFARGQTVVAILTPSDGEDLGEGVPSAPTLVGNAPPVVHRISLGPEFVYTDSPAFATVETSDADGDKVSFVVTWSVDGVVVAANDGMLHPDAYEKGQAVTAQAIAWDGFDPSAPNWSGLLTIRNSPPRELGVTVNPPWPVAGQDPLICTVTQPAFDPDQDVVTYVASWTVDGEPYPRPGDRGGRATRWPGDTVHESDVQPGQRWVCEATPFDVTDAGIPAQAEALPLLPHLRAVAAGDGHSCAIELDGSVRCWGRNVAGSAVPPEIIASRLAVGFDETCALDSRGFVRCWGANPRVSQVPLGLYTDLSMMFSHACAVRTDRTIACWGSNTSGESSPPGQATFVQVTAGVDHACGRELDGDLACWGSNAEGQLDIPAGGPWADVAAGGSFTCAISAAGALACWGAEGVTTTTPAGTFRELSAGFTHVCAVAADDSAVCWGDGADLTPPEGAWISVTTGTSHACGLRTDATVDCWGDTTVGQAIAPTVIFAHVAPGNGGVCGTNEWAEVICWGDPTAPLLQVPPDLPLAGDLVVGGDHACAIHEDGQFTCWGADEHGEASPTITHAGLLSAAPGLTCAIGLDGTLACWGANDEGQAEPPPGDAWIDVAVGPHHGCALDAFGVVTCWGSADDGRLDVPVDLRFVDIDVGEDTSCGVNIDGTLACWGEPLAGTSKPNDSGYARVTVDDAHACATRVNGEVVCWGDATNSRLAAPDVSLLDVRAAHDQTCGVSWDHEARCWGTWVR